MSKNKENKLFFVTSNKNKFNEVKAILKKFNIEILWLNKEYLEVQANDIKTIAVESAKKLSIDLENSFFLEDTGLFIEVLNGFPGPYSAYVFKTIGNEGILKLLEKQKNRSAFFETCVAFYDAHERTIKTFIGHVDGVIAKSIRGRGWGYDPIFIPIGYDKTYAELGEKKNEVSHRTIAMQMFARWYLAEHLKYKPKS